MSFQTCALYRKNVTKRSLKHLPEIHLPVSGAGKVPEERLASGVVEDESSEEEQREEEGREHDDDDTLKLDLLPEVVVLLVHVLVVVDWVDVVDGVVIDVVVVGRQVGRGDEDLGVELKRK